MPNTPTKTPLGTCEADTCVDCTVQSHLNCHFNRRDLAFFLTASLPGLILGALGIYRYFDLLLIPWASILLGFFWYGEVRVLCTHCPHYGEPGERLRCWANYGARKRWEYALGPMAGWEKGALFLGFGAVWGYPLVLMVLGEQWLLLAIYLAACIVFFTVLTRLYCSRCVNFNCPLNRVSEKIRTEFLKPNKRTIR